MFTTKERRAIAFVRIWCSVSISIVYKHESIRWGVPYLPVDTAVHLLMRNEMKNPIQSISAFQPKHSIHMKEFAKWTTHSVQVRIFRKPSLRFWVQPCTWIAFAARTFPIADFFVQFVAGWGALKFANANHCGKGGVFARFIHSALVGEVVENWYFSMRSLVIVK